MTTTPVALGLDTFGDVTRAPDGRLLSHAEVLRHVVAEGVLADEVGLDFFGVGEHHRDDFAVSAPEVVLAAIAARTTRIRLGSAVTVLSSDDPVRVHQRFATLDGLSGGRAEVILGRGSFTESYPLFGHPLDDYERLFEEKLDLFVKLRAAGPTAEPVTWESGSAAASARSARVPGILPGTVPSLAPTRPALAAQRVWPTTAGAPLRTWIGVGGSPQSVVRAARHGLPLVLAIIGGDPRRFAPYVALYRRELAARGLPALPIAVHSPGHVAATDDEARERLWPAYRAMHDRIGGERGWPPLGREAYEHEIVHGSLYVGSAETVARKIAATVSALGLARFDLKYSAGALSHEAMLDCIGRYGREVVPRVRELVG